MALQEKTQMQKRLNRARLIEFEKEIEERLESLNAIEAEMKTISEQRRDWLENISKNHSSESDIYLQRVELVKAQADQLSLTLKIDILKLESQYETMRLGKLVEYTQPLRDNEREEDRIETLKLQGRKDSESLRLLLQHSLDHRLEIAQLASNLLQHLSRLQHQSELEQDEKAKSMTEHLGQYCDNMSESIEKASLLYGDIVREYLILRHNAQVAKEILLRNQNDAMFARQELQLKLQKLTKDAAAKRRKHETAAAQELKLKLSELRSEVMRKEKHLEEMKIEVREMKQTKKGEANEMITKISETKKRFMKLQKSRRETTVKLMGEVDALRTAVQTLTNRQIGVSEEEEFMSTEALLSSQILREQVKRMLQKLTQQHALFHRHQYPFASQEKQDKKKKNKKNMHIRFADGEDMDRVTTLNV